MTRVSKDNPFYYLTFVTNRRLPVFRTNEIATVASKAFSEARSSGQFAIYGYAIMPDHVHMITGSERKPSDVLRFLKGISARRVIGYLKENGYTSSLEKPRRNRTGGAKTYSLWQHHSNTKLITSESFLMQKINYIHLNPIRERLASVPAEYGFSSARIWQGMALSNEPLLVDCSEIEWSA